jgi:hypothetical protein
LATPETLKVIWSPAETALGTTTLSSFSVGDEAEDDVFTDEGATEPEPLGCVRSVIVTDAPLKEVPGGADNMMLPPAGNAEVALNPSAYCTPVALAVEGDNEMLAPDIAVPICSEAVSGLDVLGAAALMVSVWLVVGLCTPATLTESSSPGATGLPSLSVTDWPVLPEPAPDTVTAEGALVLDAVRSLSLYADVAVGNPTSSLAPELAEDAMVRDPPGPMADAALKVPIV